MTGAGPAPPGGPRNSVVWRQDILGPGRDLGPAPDLVLCTEVAEHMAPEHAGRLVSVLCDGGAPWIVFTAAPPGQGGLDHVNEQEQEYWIEKFAARGYRREDVPTILLWRLWLPITRLSHLAQNVIVFEKGTT